MKPALELLDLLDELDGKGTSVIDLARAGQPLVPWRLYPGESGIFDRRTRCQVYYHSHGLDSEAGHFHTVRLSADHTVHLVAISHLAEHAGPLPLVRFVNLMFQAFGAQIERLQHEKIATLDRYRATDPGQDVFEDRSLEILSRDEVDVRAAAADAASTKTRYSGKESPA
jgi:hypothetical protein